MAWSLSPSRSTLAYLERRWTAPGWRALEALRTGRASALLIAKLDRLTRSVRDLGALVERYFVGDHCTLMSVADNIDTLSATGRLVLNVLVSVSQWEREAIGERTSVALQHVRRKGVKMGRAPYGWRYGEQTDPDGHRVLIRVEAEQTAIARIMRMVQDGDTYAVIASALNASGITARWPMNKASDRPGRQASPPARRRPGGAGLIAPPPPSVNSPPPDRQPGPARPGHHHRGHPDGLEVERPASHRPR